MMMSTLKHKTLSIFNSKYQSDEDFLKKLTKSLTLTLIPIPILTLIPILNLILILILILSLILILITILTLIPILQAQCPSISSKQHRQT